jgi:hypothetical protein
VFRRARGEFIDAQIEREIAADRAELAQLKAEYNQAVGNAKTKLQAKVEAVQNRLNARRDQLKEKIEAINRESEARVESLQEKAAKAKGATKARLEKIIAEERAYHKVRVEKLSQAWQLIKEAAATL